MKYCIKCGAELPDGAMFCPKCGEKVSQVENNNKKQEILHQTSTNSLPNNSKTTIKAKPIEEQKAKEFLPPPLALIACSIIVWILNGTVGPSGIAKIMPLILFVLLSGFFSAIQIYRAIKTYKKEMYFEACLSLVLGVLLFVCLIMNFIFLVS